MSAVQFKSMTEQKAVAVVVACGFAVSKVQGESGTHAYKVVDTHGVAKVFTPQELRRSAWLWS